MTLIAKLALTGLLAAGVAGCADSRYGDGRGYDHGRYDQGHDRRDDNRGGAAYDPNNRDSRYDGNDQTDRGQSDRRPDDHADRPN